jgi:TolA-binding protein
MAHAGWGKHGAMAVKVMKITISMVLLLGLVSSVSARGVTDVTLTPEEWEKLDTFEHHILSKADETFQEAYSAKGEKKFRQAWAEYDTFIAEFPRSQAVPYAILRKGRSRQNDGKQFQAIAEYQEVLDYFPNSINYASAALFRMGECHWKNGDINKAMKAWAEMANDEDYSRHRLAAYAINRLADNLIKQDKVKEAVKYYEQVAVGFRKTNSQAAQHAAGPVYEYYIRTVMDEARYRDFYIKFKGLKKDKDALDEDDKYWGQVMAHVGSYGKFEQLQTELKVKYFTYWIGKLAGKFPDNDGYQLTLINWRFDLDKDIIKWMQAMDRLFKRKPADYNRIMQWLGYYDKYEKKVQEYYSMLDFSKLTFAQRCGVIRYLFGKGLNSQARSALRRLSWNKMTDDQVAHVAGIVPRSMFKDIIMRMKDKNRAKSSYIGFCHRYRKPKEGLPFATELTKVPEYAKQAWTCKADFLFWIRKYKEAISAYRQVDNPPGTLWSIVSCYLELGDTASAVGLLMEIEKFFEDQAPRAAFKIAEVYKQAGDKKKYISSLRGVLKKYPKSGESSAAHQRLEALGIRIGGAIDAE